LKSKDTVKNKKATVQKSPSGSFVALFDAHVGWENIGNKKRRPIHNRRAISAALEFIQYVKPTHGVLGGDQLDCSSVSHWNKNKRRAAEGLRLGEDITEFNNILRSPLEEIIKGRKIWLNGNHERFILDLLDDYAGLEDILDIRKLCALDTWEWYENGALARIGKLWFAHGDNLRGKHVAMAAVEMYQRNIRVGHNHTYQAHTMISPIDVQDLKTGISVPCLANRGPNYGNNAPNRWANGLLYGEFDERGNFADSVLMFTDNAFRYNGKVFRG
jgi:hypothetical protein